MSTTTTTPKRQRRYLTEPERRRLKYELIRFDDDPVSTPSPEPDLQAIAPEDFFSELFPHCASEIHADCPGRQVVMGELVNRCNCPCHTETSHA